MALTGLTGQGPSRAQGMPDAALARRSMKTRYLLAVLIWPTLVETVLTREFS